MKLIFSNSNNINFSCKDDLLRVIPENIEGTVLSYGQGEGQVRISNTVWGLYVNDENNYYMVYEEGSENWEQLRNLVDDITNKLKKEFELNIIVTGSLSNIANV